MRFFNLFSKYFSVSIKTFSTWVLILFNLFLLSEFYLKKIFIEELVLSYLIQISISIFFFGILLLSLRKFVTIGKPISPDAKGLRLALVILVLFIWIFYGIAIYILTTAILPHLNKLGSNFFLGVLIVFCSVVMNFIFNFLRERERIEKTNFVKVFFEPAGNIFPTYVLIIFLSIIPFVLILILVKTFADIIINSPLNSESPFIFELLGGSEKLKRDSDKFSSQQSL